MNSSVIFRDRNGKTKEIRARQFFQVGTSRLPSPLELVVLIIGKVRWRSGSRALPRLVAADSTLNSRFGVRQCKEGLTENEARTYLARGPAQTVSHIGVSLLILKIDAVRIVPQELSDDRQYGSHIEALAKSAFPRMRQIFESRTKWKKVSDERPPTTSLSRPLY